MSTKYIIIAICVVIVLFLLVSYKRKKPIENFTSKPKVGKIMLYYMPWCGHCHNFMSTWDKFAEYANTSNDFPVFANKINCEERGDVCSAASVSGYPTVVLIKNDGTTVRFEKNRTYENLVSFVKENCA